MGTSWYKSGGSPDWLRQPARSGPLGVPRPLVEPEPGTWRTSAEPSCGTGTGGNNWEPGSHGPEPEPGTYRYPWNL